MTEALIPIAIEAAAALWKANADLSLKEKVVDFFRRKDTILVLGSTGCGKTNLLISLSAAGDIVDPVPSQSRTQASETARVRVGGRPFLVTDTPGQRHHSPDRNESIRLALANPPVRVMNVVSYGYHEYKTSARTALAPNGDADADFLERHRRSEINAAREWLPVLGDSASTAWILTVVTKADLWWDRADEVLEYYSRGQYAEEISKRDKRLRHAVLPYCSVMHKFFGTGRLSGAFDDEDRIRTNLHFLSQLTKLG